MRKSVSLALLVLCFAGQTAIAGQKKSPAKQPDKNPAAGIERVPVPASDLSPKEIAAKVLKSVVFIKSKDVNNKSLGFGSGFFIADDWIVTNYHVIKGAAYINASSVTKSKVDFPCKIHAVDEVNDLAIVEVFGLTGDALEISGDEVAIGDRVYAVGNPEGMGGTFSEGLVSSLRRLKKSSEIIIQHTAAISRGSSGGPLVNSRAKVVGINTATIFDGQNLNFAIPVSVLDKLIISENRYQTNQNIKTGPK